MALIMEDLEKSLKMKDFLENSLKISPDLKITGESLLGLEKYLSFTLFCKTTLLIDTKISI